jgi:hypothetical protein
MVSHPTRLYLTAAKITDFHIFSILISTKQPRQCNQYSDLDKGWTIWGSNFDKDTSRTWKLSLLQNVHTGSAVHPAS